MISYLQIENLTKSFGDRLLFGDVTFGINEGDKIGIVAKNGTGKSTLLGIIAGDIAADSGNITARNGLRIGYLPQTPAFEAGETALQRCLRVENPDSHLESALDRENAARRLLCQLGIAEADSVVDTMSGGQRKRVALACAILQKPDMMILDEPTHHLDVDVIEWLEGYLRRQRMTLLMVTHDRYFLDRVCSKIIEIDNCSTFVYEGNYDYYLRRRAERIEALSAERERARNTLRREQEWMSRQPQARAGKAKYRIDQYYDLRERARRPIGDSGNINLAANTASYIGSKIFEAVDVCKRYADKVILDHFSYTFARHEKIGIIGPNGVGKSTFVKMLQGLVAPDSGAWNVGETVRFGYYSQEGIAFDESKRVIDAVSELADDIVLDDGRHITPMQYLTRFLFSVPDQQKYIAKLSGGERCRLHLAVTLMRRPNFLILDEPTNDLDIITLGILEEYLASFGGCAIIISHDRYFLDNIADHLFVMEGNGVVRDFPGTYSEWREFKNAEAAAAAAATAKPKTQERNRAERPRRLSFKERREMEQLSADIEALSAERAALEEIFNSGTQIADIADKAQRYEQVKEALDEKEMRWLELSEIED